MGCKKQDTEQQEHCYSNREEAALPLFFLNSNDPVFFISTFWTFFPGSQTDPCLQNKNGGCRLTGHVGLLDPN